MAFMETYLNIALDAMTAAADSVSLHTGDPSTTGANELSGGGYSRQTPDWTVASGAAVEINDPLVYSIPAGNVIEYVGLWDGTTWRGSIALEEEEPFNNDGELTIQTLTITAVNA